MEQLMCRVASALPPPAFVFWYKEDIMVNYDYSNRFIWIFPVLSGKIHSWYAQSDCY
jgi:hypothetical protein